MKKIGDIVEGVESAANRSMTAESRLNDKLKMLRDNIKQARAQAEKVRDHTIIQNLHVQKNKSKNKMNL